MIMEAEKSQDMQFESWKPWRANGIALVQVQRTKDQENQWCKF